jgi:hypothetical protein
MEKTIKIGKVPVRLNNNIGWSMAYRDQFGQDIIPVIMPMLAGALDIITGLLNSTEKPEEIKGIDILKQVDGDTLIDAIAHLSALEFVDLINITWALAKCADDEIPEPKEWVKQFDTFPVDVVAPAVFELVGKGLISSKNWRRKKCTS